ncbi:MAG: sigma-54 dependent transcriptional regulator [Nitrospira sp.]|jgi:DNA-binding NtrC family response regulator|nr:sigma-54-dependent Fis family transcriptional regulator [Nitrospira sp.]MBP6604718.1 sigma-54-dependent Fis family transcriptional regulator [Nitrospira sp.]MCI1280019.1 sigma-54 dependent transcriptional regulator [Nitrospira sp.]HQY58090.1 sigma-54 dependent transcriptional regulator [Nitrospira sp.]HRA97972.1 sigma-54 dependent transcriptional regulator [Nitrospira sp.]
MKAKVLIVDDDQDIVTMLQDRLDAGGYKTLTAADGLRGIELIEQESPNLVLLDLYLPRLKGMDVLKRMAQNKQFEDIPVIVMTAAGTIPDAVEAMRHGAYDFLTKPLEKDHLLIVIQKALERDSLKRQVAALQSDVQNRYATIVGDSSRIKGIIESAHRAANSDASILLLGESGTGKELFARSIHQWSPRQNMPMVVINCVALTETLLENELFGHERGAYTSADRLQKGKLEMAEGGTVFLDEIGDMPLPLQAKLLRVLQDKEFQRVGGTRSVSVNIRFVAATNKDLKQAVKAGQFREDLFFRLNVVSFTLPPLRERSEDIERLAEFFLKRHAYEAKRPGVSLSPSARAALTHYPWPGNIRELDNVLSRAVVLSPSDVIEPEFLALSPDDVTGKGHSEHALPYLSLTYHESMEAHSAYIIERALEKAAGNQTKAAEFLDLQRTYLARLIKQRKSTPDE